jgi:hypothetical protein
MYTVSSYYFSLQKIHLASFFENLSGGDYYTNVEELSVVESSLQAFLDRLPMIRNIDCRGIISIGEDVRMCCSGVLETENHILASCPFAWAISHWT